MEIKKTDEEKIVNFGAFEYNAQKMANILGIEKSIIEAEMKNKTSVFFTLYQKGQDMADYVIDQKIFEKAQSGDLMAVREYEKRRNRQKLAK